MISVHRDDLNLDGLVDNFTLSEMIEVATWLLWTYGDMDLVFDAGYNNICCFGKLLLKDK